MSIIGKYLLSHFLFFFLVALPTVVLRSQVRFTVTTDQKEVSIEGFLQVQYVIEDAEDIQKFDPPNFKHFRIVSGPTHVTSTYLVGDVLHPYTSFIYILQPTKLGEFSLGSASALVNGRPMYSDKCKVSVTYPGATANPYHFYRRRLEALGRDNLYSDYLLRKSEDIVEKIRRNLFIRVDIDKKSCFEGEPVVATYKLYTRLRSESKVVKHPSFNGFSVYDMADPESEMPAREKFNGKEYNVYLIRKAQLYPSRSGELQLDEVEIDNTITFIRAEEAGMVVPGEFPQLLQSFEKDDTRNPAVEVQKLSISSRPVLIKVKPLPAAPQTDSFHGAVGNFTIQARAPQGGMTADAVSTIDIVVSGKGNLPVINAPAVQWPKGFESFAAESEEQFERHRAPMQGSKIFHFKFVPTQQGLFTIPPIKLTYFDPARSRYNTVQTDSVHLQIAEGKAPGKMEGINEERKMGFFQMNKSLILSTALVLLLILFLLLRWQWRLKPQQSAPVTPSQSTLQEETASPFLSDPLLDAKLMLVRQDNKGFYHALGHAIWIYLSEYYTISASHLKKGVVEARMRQQGCDEITIEQFNLLVNQCELALYTPSATENDMQAAYDLAEDFIAQMNERRAQTS